MKRQELTARTKYWKERLLTMCKAGHPRPSAKSLEGKKLAMYAYQSNDMFDPDFRQAVDPWFARKSRKSDFLSRTPDVKPAWDTKEGRRFQEWMKDPNFRRAMYEKRPGWFKGLQPAKDEILELARSGAPKPNYRHRVLVAMRSYLDPESKDFDPKFLIDLTVARPDWVLPFKGLNYSKAKSA